MVLKMSLSKAEQHIRNLTDLGFIVYDYQVFGTGKATKKYYFRNEMHRNETIRNRTERNRELIFFSEEKLYNK